MEEPNGNIGFYHGILQSRTIFFQRALVNFRVVGDLFPIIYFPDYLIIKRLFIYLGQI